MTHPCAGHPCDHCFTCDVLGVCCASISAEQRARLEADQRAPDSAQLRAAIAQEARTVPSLPELVRREAWQALPTSARLGLLMAPVSDPLSSNPRKEALHVISARPNR